MNEYFLMYLIYVATSIQATATFIAACSGVFTLFLFIALLLTKAHGEEEDVKPVVRTFKNKVYITVLCTSFALATILPSEDSIYLIAGGGAALKGVNNEEVQDIPSNAAKALNMWLEKQIEDSE
jgi:hypothetical protein